MYSFVNYAQQMFNYKSDSRKLPSIRKSLSSHPTRKAISFTRKEIFYMLFLNVGFAISFGLALLIITTC